MQYVVKRALREKGTAYPVGCVVSPSDFRHFQLELRSRHIVPLNKEFKDFYKTKFGATWTEELVKPFRKHLIAPYAKDAVPEPKITAVDEPTPDFKQVTAVIEEDDDE